MDTSNGWAMAESHPQERLRGAYGHDRFGRGAERFARFFGTPKFIVGQTILVALWIALNAIAVSIRWDGYPFILLNLAFSTQAAYAAPLILLAQTRQADRDAHHSHVLEEARHRQEARHTEVLEQNERMIRRIESLAEEIRRAVQ